MDDLGSPSSYLVLEPGVDVFSRDGERLGEVQHVLADPEADLFDGIVVDTSGLPGGLRFVDAPHVAGVEDVDRSELHEKLRRAWETISGQGLDKR